MLLFALAAALGPVWWQLTAPPTVTLARPWQDASGGMQVPHAAVRNLDAARGYPAPPHVFVITDGVARRTLVELGRVGADAVEIRAGLALSDMIAANPPRGLEDRHRVIPRP